MSTLEDYATSTQSMERPRHLAMTLHTDGGSSVGLSARELPDVLHVARPRTV